MNGWHQTRLGSVAAISGGLTKNPRRAALPLSRPYLTVANVYANRLDLTEVAMIGVTEGEIERAVLQPGDLLVVEGNGSLSQLGRVAVWNGALDGCLHQNHLIKVRLLPAVASSWILYWLLSPEGRDAIEKVGSSTSGLHTLSISKVAALPVRYPSLWQQHRIVAEIEKQFTRLDAAVATLERVKAQLKRARASVLKAAVEGRLVPTEATLARAEGRDYEPASVLLERILAERKAAWARSGARGKYKEPVAPDTAGLPHLPEGWCWASMDSLADIVGGITKDSKQTEGRAVPYLRVANVQRGRLNLSDVKSIVAPEAKIAALRLRVGDILLNEGGDRDKLGRGWVWRGEVEECIHQNHVFRARLWRLEFDSRYLSHYANTEGDRYFLAQGKQTTNLASISLSKVKALPIALPPAVEIARILSEVDRRLSALDALDAAVDRNLARCARLRQSILKRAFEGKLVPPEPSIATATAPRSTEPAIAP